MKKKLAVTIGLFALLCAASRPGIAGDTPAMQEVQVTAVSPAIFGADATISINGSGFVEGDIVSLDAVTLESIEIKANVISAKVPAKAKKGAKLIIKRGRKKLATFSTFTFAKAPKVLRTTPLFGTPGESIKVVGDNLDSVEKLSVGTTVIIIADKQKKSISFTVPAGLTTGELTVSGPGGSATLKKPLEIFYPPVVGAVQPAAVFPGDDVTVTGNYFETKGIKFSLGKKQLKAKDVTATKATISIPKVAKTDVIRVTARKKSAESQSPLTVYAVPALNVAPKLAPSPGTITIKGKNLDVVQQWSIGAKKLEVDTTAKNSAKQISLRLPEDLNISDKVIGTYMNRQFAAKKATTVAAAPQIGAVQLKNDAAQKSCEYTVYGKNFTSKTAFQLGKKKLKSTRITDTDAILTTKGACSTKYNQMSAQNGAVKGAAYTFNPAAGGYTFTPEETKAALTAGKIEYSPRQIMSDISLMNATFQGTSSSFESKGKAATSTAAQKEVEQVSEDVGDALLRLALAEQAVCTAMQADRKAAKANAELGQVLDEVVKKESHLMKNVLIPLWSRLPQAAMAKKVRLNTVDDEVVLIDSVDKKRNPCANKYYGERLVADATKTASLDLNALHEQALLGALSNLSQNSTNAVVMEKELNDALWSFSSTRRTYWVAKAKTEAGKVQKSGSTTVGKGAGRNKRVEKSSKQKPTSLTGKGK
ncbi:MAG: hypothetical protein JXR76_23460 [Deltaproteobacteria bacterium]|nr:hypothetical protein [Deltaproteobacteria bacterium]